MRRSRVGSFLLSLLLVGLTSCGGGDSGCVSGPLCGDTPDPPRATTITITPNSVTLSFLGATLTLTASVRDQNGQPFSATITWSSDNPSVVTVDAAGLLTALQNGTATVTATSGSLSTTVTVTVQQAATLLAIVSGDGQSGTVGQALAEALAVRADDAGGAAVAGVNLAFVVTAGGGTVGASTVATDAQGLASTTWTLGTIAGPQSVTVSVAGSASPTTQISATGLAAAAAALVKSSGDGQVGAINLALTAPIVVKLQDEFSNGIAGGEVTFVVTQGGGAVNPATATAGADGTVQTTWTMGPAPGPAALTATATGFPPVAFAATAELATPDLVAGAISVSPANPTSQEPVTVTVPVSNNGTATTGVPFAVQLLVDGTEVGTQTIGPIGPSQLANAEFTAGPFAAGGRTLSAVVDLNGDVTESDETNNTSTVTVSVTAETALTEGTPITNVGGTLGAELLFGFQYPVADGLSIEFNLSGGMNDADMYVHRGERPASRDDYECISGAFDSNESCRFEAALTGTYHVLIHAFETFSGTTLSVTTGLAVLPYNIELVFLNSGTPSQNAAFTNAAARWESILPIDINDINFTNQPVEAGGCRPSTPPIEDTVDDIRIYVEIIEIDGPGGTLGQAGFCIFRVASGLPVVGFMEFDEVDVARLETDGRLGAVIRHEMGHVLGIGTAWTIADLLRNPSFGNPGVDTHFEGPLAIAAFDAAGGAGYGGAKVPVENSGTGGSADGHWRESILGKELFTPVLNAGFNPLSAISVQSLADIGYRVELGPADAFNFVLPTAAPALTQGPVIDLGSDIWQGPVLGVDGQGRIVRVIRR